MGIPDPTSPAGRRLVLFDWDGTLIHSLDLKIRNAGRLFSATAGVPADQVEAAYRRHSGIPRRELFAAIRADLRLPPLSPTAFANLSRRFTELNLQTLLAGGPGVLPPETAQTLANLRSRGCYLYVSSSADENEIRGVAEALGLADYFEAILGSRPGFGKGRDHIEWVREQHHAGLEEIVFIGDDPADVRLGRLAGVFTIAKIGTHSRERLAAERPDRLIQSLSEIDPILFPRDP